MLAVKFKLDFNQNIPLTFKLQTCLDVITKLQLIILEMHIECHAICGNFFTIILAAPPPNYHVENSKLQPMSHIRSALLSEIEDTVMWPLFLCL